MNAWPRMAGGAPRLSRRVLTGILLGLAVLAVPAAPTPTDGPVIRVGLGQRATAVRLSSRAGLQVQGPDGGLLLEVRRAVTLQPVTLQPVAPHAGTRQPVAREVGARQPGASNADARQPGAPDVATPESPAPGTPETAPPETNEAPIVPDRPAGPLLSATDTSDGEAPALAIPFSTLRIVPREEGAPLDLGKRRYRGTIEVRVDARGRLTVVNLLPLEEYLRGVLPMELSPSAPLQALRAQAIVARTFTFSALGRHRADGFDVCDGTHCQVYAGAGHERDATDRAVRETRGLVLRHEGKLVPTYYHAACGGATDSPSEVWSGASDFPCLAGVIDAPAPLGEELATEPGILSLALRGAEFYCGGSREFSWEFERTRAELERTLERTLPGILGKRVRLGTLQALVVTGRTRSGRVRSLEVRGSEGTVTLRGDSIRWAFNSGRPEAPALPSTRFVVRPVACSSGEEKKPERYRFYGLGSGHGAGLCQSGAIGMARRGHDAERILAHYFPGASIAPAIGGAQ